MPLRCEYFYVPYQGPSTNSIYAGKHWIKRKQDKDQARDVVARTVSTELFQLPVALQFVPVIGRGARARDLSNYTYAIKLIEDGLVASGVLKDDTNEYVQSIRIYGPVVDRGREPGFVLAVRELAQGGAECPWISEAYERVFT